MALPLPTLDNRTFDQLVDECTAQIARLSPSWTNYNAADPGITLLELCAWLSEQNLYRTDRVSDEMTRAFLRLVNCAPAPPTVADTVVLLETSEPAAVYLPDRVQLVDYSNTIAFETRAACTVSAARLVKLLAAGDPPLDVTTANTFLPFGASPAPGAAFYVGFDAPLGAAGTPISLYVWTVNSAQDEQTRAALLLEQAAVQVSAERACPQELIGQLVDWRTHFEVATVWEYLSIDSAWRAIPNVEDETRALSLSGFVRFEVPQDQAPGGPGMNWFVRCRIVCGSFTCTTQLAAVGLNAVVAEHAASIDVPEALGTSLGHASEVYATSLTPVVAGSTELSLVLGSERDDRWTEMQYWDLVGPHGRNYVLQPELGRITIGNGKRGAVLPSGCDLLLNYRVGGGIAGNISAGTLTQLAASEWNGARIAGGLPVAATITATQPMAASGGAVAEALAAAEARAVAELTTPARAITIADIVALTEAVPGVPVARATALPNTHPAMPCFTAPGSITVIVVPDCPSVAPTPSSGFLRAVARFLDRRRPLTTELHVIAPTYVTAIVIATLQASPSANPSTIPGLAQAALDAFFNPLIGGPDGMGWPIGRAVYRTEVMSLLASLPGVLTVTGLSLQAGAAVAVCGNLDICPTDLIRSGTHQVSATITGASIFSRSKKREC